MHRHKYIQEGRGRQDYVMALGEYDAGRRLGWWWCAVKRVFVMQHDT
jgi:hypothetical protein